MSDRRELHSAAAAAFAEAVGVSRQRRQNRRRLYELRELRDHYERHEEERSERYWSQTDAGEEMRKVDLLDDRLNDDLMDMLLSGFASALLALSAPEPEPSVSS